MSERDTFIWLLDKAEAKTNERPVNKETQLKIMEEELQKLEKKCEKY